MPMWSWSGVNKGPGFVPLLDDNASRALTMAVGGFADQWNRQWIEVHDVTDIPNDGEARGCEL